MLTAFVACATACASTSGVGPTPLASAATRAASAASGTTSTMPPGMVMPTPSGGSWEPVPDPQNYVPKPAGIGGGSAVVACRFNHSATDDPIVHPGQPGTSHRHDFYGATIDAFSTFDSMRSGPSTCLGDDHSGYWFPSFVIDGAFVPADHDFQTYYRSDRGCGSWQCQTVNPFPAGLKMVSRNYTLQCERFYNPNAEDMTKKGLKQRYPEGVRDAAGGFSCPAPYSVVVTAEFQNCWDGLHLDSPDHMSHVAFSDGAGHCPATHPIPLIKVVVGRSVPYSVGKSVTLASGGIDTMHADFFNGWDPATIRRTAELCINKALTKCKTWLPPLAAG